MASRRNQVQVRSAMPSFRLRSIPRLAILGVILRRRSAVRQCATPQTLSGCSLAGRCPGRSPGRTGAVPAALAVASLR